MKLWAETVNTGLTADVDENNFEILLFFPHEILKTFTRWTFY